MWYGLCRKVKPGCVYPDLIFIPDLFKLEVGCFKDHLEQVEREGYGVTKEFLSNAG